VSSPSHAPLDRGESAQNGLASADAAARGGYILAEGMDSEPAVLLIATGSEVHFGASAGQAKLYQEYGFTAQRVAAAARSSLGLLNAIVRSEES
jgi:transketolase